MPMTEQQIEQINRLAPFRHSVWQGRGITVTNEGQQEGRVQFMASRIREAILSNFTTAELETMTILDVGCNDGWVLHQLEDLPFRQMVGVEPRRKNILRGEEIRRLLGIETRIQFKLGTIETLPEDQYDIVLSLGTLHHVESIPCAMRSLDRVTSRLLLIESIVLPSEHITSAVRRDIEMKDVIYKYMPLECGLTGQKYESSVNDGSTTTTTVVSVPSIETLLMHLAMLGYETTLVAAPDDFQAAMTKYTRPSQEAMIAAKKGESPFWDDLETHEQKLADKVLPRPLVMQLLSDWRSCCSASCDDPLIHEIMQNIHYAPEDLCNLEYGKLLLSEGNTREAVTALKRITQKLNADWWAAHRAFRLLDRIESRDSEM